MIMGTKKFPVFIHYKIGWRKLKHQLDCYKCILQQPQGEKSVMNQITLDHPAYLCELWHYAINMLGDNATFSSIAELINQQSAVNPDLLW